MRTILLPILLVIFSVFGTNAQSGNVDFGTFMSETQQNKSKPGEVRLAWWIPVEFWEISLKGNKDLTPQQISEFISVLSEYFIVAYLEGSVNDMAEITYISSDKIFNSIKVTGNDGKTYEPIAPENIQPEIDLLLTTMQPLLANTMGEMGENLNFYVFYDYNKGKRVADPQSEGTVKVQVKKEQFLFPTPLSMYSEAKICPVDKQAMKGSWKYCPFHGEKL